MNLLACASGAFAKHDNAFCYSLPYCLGEGYVIGQGYGGSTHNGESFYSIDFVMPEGTTVCAARDGVIVRIIDCHNASGFDKSYSQFTNFVEVEHEDLSAAMYAHLAPKGVLVRPGQIVRRNEAIALSGNTGWSKSPHLHFHVLSNGHRVPTLFETHLGKCHLKVHQKYYHPSPNKLID